MGVFPAELVRDILEYLPIDALWTAARVSRQWYAAAWCAGLFIHRHITWTPDRGSEALAVFKGVLERAKLKDLRLGLTVRCYSASDGDKASQSAAEELYPLISAAAPFLVYLSIRTSDCFRPLLDGALRFQAPRLREFEMRREAYGAPYPPPLPYDIFGRSAPRLHTVRLDAVTLPDTPVPAFRAVSHATVTHRKVFPHVEIGNHFPSLTSLHLGFIDRHSGELVLPDRFDIAPLALRSLIIDDFGRHGATPLLDVIMQCVDLSSIPVVEVNSRRIWWYERLWTDDTAALSMRVNFRGDGSDFLRVAVVPEHQRWRRLYTIIPWIMDTLPISGLPNIGARLAYLHIDARLLGHFLALQRPFPAMRGLHVDVRSQFFTFAPDGGPDLHSFDPQHQTPCPALATITLFALDAPVSGANSRRVALLAHALGQLQRPQAERATLALVGIELAQPGAHALLEQAVSEIRTYAFACEDYNGGAWERALDMVS